MGATILDKELSIILRHYIKHIIYTKPYAYVLALYKNKVRIYTLKFINFH